MLLPDQSAETVVVIGYIRAVAVGYLFLIPIASCISIAGKGNSGVPAGGNRIRGAGALHLDLRRGTRAEDRALHPVVSRIVAVAAGDTAAGNRRVAVKAVRGAVGNRHTVRIRHAGEVIAVGGVGQRTVPCLVISQINILCSKTRQYGHNEPDSTRDDVLPRFFECSDSCSFHLVVFAPCFSVEFHTPPFAKPSNKRGKQLKAYAEHKKACQKLDKPECIHVFLDYMQCK